MAAPTEATLCDTRVTAERTDGTRVPLLLDELLHSAWIEYLHRDRRAVVEAFLQKQCDDQGVLEVELVNRCDDHRGTHAYTLRCGGERAHQTERTAAR
jgi:hypothetical protein